MTAIETSGITPTPKTGLSRADLIFLTAVTGTYLLIEMAFSGWLIDVLGSDSPSRTIGRAEHFGRLLSGFAVALLFWPWILKQAKLLDRLAMLILMTLGIMFGVYHAEKLLIENLVEQSEEHARAAAVTGSLLRNGLITGQVKKDMLGGLWSEEIAESPTGKAFIGISAFMAAGSELARTQTMAIAPALIRADTDTKIGGVDAEFDRYKQSVQSIEAAFDEYQKGILTHKDLIANADAHAAQAWEEYLDQVDAMHPYWGRWALKRNALRGQVAVGKAIGKIRQSVQERGIMVPDNWRTGDRATFIREARKAHIKQADKVLEERLQGMSKNLDIRRFAAHSTTQSSWKEALGYADLDIKLPMPSLSKADFSAQIYPKVLAHRTEKVLKNYQGSVVDFADGGPMQEQGRAAFEAMIAPVFALSLSLIGALVHLFKTGFLALHLGTGIHIRSPIIKFLAVIGGVATIIFACFSLVKTPLTSHPTYRQWASISNQIDSNRPISIYEIAMGSGLDALIKTHSIAYPAFSLIKNQLQPVTAAPPLQGLIALIDN